MKFLDLHVEEGSLDDRPGVFFTFEGDRYWLSRYSNTAPLNCVRWAQAMNCYVTDRSRDFGGCGKDAVKLEINVPFRGWLNEVYAVKVQAANQEC